MKLTVIRFNQRPYLPYFEELLCRRCWQKWSGNCLYSHRLQWEASVLDGEFSLRVWNKYWSITL